MKVHYFPGYGRAEAVRMLLAHAKVPFENVNYTFESLPAAKESGNLEFGQLPVLEMDGKFYAQSFSIVRMLGIKYGYYSEDAYTAWRIDSTIDSIGDLLNAYYKAAFARDEEEKKALFKTFYETTFTKWLTVIDKRVKENTSQKYIVGDKITIADFTLAALAYSTFLNENNPSKDVQRPIVEQFPVLLAYFQSLGEDLKEYLSTRISSPW